MTIAEWCIVAAAVLPYLVIAPAKLAGRAEYDNAEPRKPGFYSLGFRARCWGAHLNGFEAFPVFAIAVLLAEFRDMPQTAVDSVAAGFIVARLLYTWMYLSNRPTLRSAAWFAGFGLSLVLLTMPAWLGPPTAS